MNNARPVAIFGGQRIPFCRSVTKYSELGNKQLMTGALKALVTQYKLEGREIGEVALGAVLKRSKDFSLARECAIDAGLSFKTPAFDLQKACGTSLEAAILLGNKIALGQIDSAIAGGTDTSSDVPIELSIPLSQKLVQSTKARSLLDRVTTFGGLSPKDLVPKVPGVKEPRTGLSMGYHCEMMAQEWKIPRTDQDQLAFESHRNAASAYEMGFFRDLVSSFHGVDKDNNLRPDTTALALAKLKPAFERSEKGTLTAGNSSAMTDGASAALLGSIEWGRGYNLEPWAFLKDAQSAAINYESDEGLLMAPAYAVAKLLERNKLTLQDFDFYEIHEAFAAQVLCTLAAWNDEKFCKQRLNLSTKLGEIDRSKLNVKGSSLALGHPFAATGTRILATAAKLLKEKGKGRALISVCTAGGMGVTAILEA